MRPETRLVRTGIPRPAGTPLTVPLYQTSGFSFDDLETFADGMGRPDGAFVYTRMGNPTVRVLEDAVADLEGGAAGLAAASGMGAIGSVLHGVLRTGDHVVAQRDLYGGTHALLRDLAERWGVTVTRVSGHDPDELRAALGPRTRLLYLETIANPTGHVSDLAALAAVAREAGVLVAVDNTFATPLLCRPLEHGADVVVHSTTKYLAGHSDVIGGLTVFADAALHREVWEHAVSAVHWPGLPDQPGHEVAGRLLSGCGGTFSFDLVGGRAAGEAFVGALRLVKPAPSLGGTETLVLHPARTSHRRLDEAELREAGIAGGTIRLSAGVEHVDDLWDDLANALP
ncbi:trans-sulfuration enzyme family protein [Saccharothrix yanglingensis]|uniref:Cystathionine gamma-synthase n=1 Tax=Saccharothrix yanglingensis TaxID=659496 RepID=A0ABU0X767_9PSEU|nr:aminotransferase class V-fold PLP-dependent enzyme [Saccharothrix yanglingensis]MDQ2587462.1 cystathionine gamma-synthase [Saccharothrix yanglingensis]